MPASVNQVLDVSEEEFKQLCAEFAPEETDTQCSGMPPPRNWSNGLANRSFAAKGYAANGSKPAVPATAAEKAESSTSKKSYEV